VTDYFIEALLALGALLAGAAAVIKASSSYKLAKARLAEVRLAEAPWAAKIERLTSELDALGDKHNDTRERVARLEGHRNGQRHHKD